MALKLSRSAVESVGDTNCDIDFMVYNYIYSSYLSVL